MIDPDNMRVRQCNEPFPLQIVWFTQLSCRKLLRVRKPFRFRLQELLHTTDQFLHLVQPDIFSRLMRMVVAGAEVDRGKIQMRRQNGNVAEASERCLEAKAVDMSLELPVAALIEYRVVAARAIQLHDIIDVWFDSGLCKGTCPVSAGFLILTEQDVTMDTLNQAQDHIHACPVIAANSLRRHHDRAVCGIADRFRLCAMDRVQMRNQQDRHRPFRVQKASLLPHGISVLNQLCF